MNIPEDLWKQFVDFVGVSEIPNMPKKIELDQWDRVYLGTRQSAWVDISYWWEPNKTETPPQRSCRDLEYFPFLGGRLVRDVRSIGD